MEPPSNASKVVCSGEGLRAGTMGKEIKCVIDTRWEGNDLFLDLLCTLPGRRPGTAEGGERARPGRVLVFFVHFSPCTYKVQQIKLHIHVTTGLLLLVHMITTNVYFD